MSQVSTAMVIAPPFPVECQLECDLDVPSQPNRNAVTNKVRLPSQPRISATDDARIRAHLADDFLLKDLELLSPRLWMMAKQDARSISPLHRQLVKRRSIVVTEDPRLHLVWYYDRIFIKPIPRYLLSHSFWQRFLCSPGNETLRRAILGYLRTYALLIRYESDFRIASRDDLQLIPERISFASFWDFIRHFEAIPNSDVAGRYSFGELRLSRLNFYSIFFLGRLSYHRVYPQYGDYFETFFKPMLFAFGMFSVTLDTMQVGLAAEIGWPWYTAFCRRLSTGLLAVMFGLAFWLASLFFVKFVKEWMYAINDRRWSDIKRINRA
jgi:hypothetical protein